MSKSHSKVNSGPPIWLWILLVPITLAVIAGIIVSSIPPDLEEVYNETVSAFNDPNGEDIYKKNLPLLEADPAFKDRVTYLKGRLALTQSRDPMALKLFSEIPEDSPIKADADLQSGNAHQRMGDFESAVAAFRSSLKKSTDNGLQARYNLASMYYVAGAVQLAKKELDENLQLDPEHEPSMQLRARLNVAREDYPAAKKDFEAVLSTSGKFASAAPDFVTQYFACLVELGDVEKLKETSPDHLGFVPDALIRSRVLLAIGENREAMMAMQSLEGPERETASAKQARLRLLLAEDDLDEALIIAKELTTQTPRDLKSMKLAGQVFEATGEERLQKIADENIQQLQDIKKQLDAAIEAVNEDVTNAQGRIEVAKLFRELGNFDQMDAWFATAAMIDPSFRAQRQEARTGKGFPTTPLVPFTEPPAPKSDTDEAAADDQETVDDSAAKDQQTDKAKSGGAKADNAKADKQSTDGKKEEGGDASATTEQTDTSEQADSSEKTAAETKNSADDSASTKKTDDVSAGDKESNSAKPEQTESDKSLN